MKKFFEDFRLVFQPIVFIGALGYFVDIFDLFLFAIVRMASLHTLQVPAAEQLSKGILLLNSQMAGLVVGGLLWGVVGDKWGRKAVLFSSILTYSVANLLNANVQSIPEYVVLRFFAGLGLAGELGAAITLVSESLSKSQRGMGTTWVATFGLFGGLAAAWIGDRLFWRHAYFLGGVLGLLLLVLRFKIQESSVYQDLSRSSAQRGSLKLLFSSKKRVKQYLSCIFAGCPVYFVSGILISFAPELGLALNLDAPIVTSKAVFYSYLGATAGDLFGGVLSQKLKNRKIVILSCILLNAATILFYLVNPFDSAQIFYLICLTLGATTGYWVVLMTLSAEQFGTNLRSTVVTSIPNFIRGSVLIFSTLFLNLRSYFGLVGGAGVIATGVLLFAIYGWTQLDETYGRDMRFLES